MQITTRQELVELMENAAFRGRMLPEEEAAVLAWMQPVYELELPSGVTVQRETLDQVRFRFWSKGQAVGRVDVAIDKAEAYATELVANARVTR